MVLDSLDYPSCFAKIIKAICGSKFLKKSKIYNIFIVVYLIFVHFGLEI